MTESRKAVFLSYASQDAEAAGRICDALRAAGNEVWFDQRELRGGDAWDQQIRRQIKECALFVPIISANTASRHEGYFRLEWNLADQRTHMIARDRAFIVPICVDATLDAGTDVPESFQRVQWTRLPKGETSPGFVQRISELVTPGCHPAPALVESSAGPASSAARSWRARAALPWIGAAVAVVLMGAYFEIDKHLLSKSSANALKRAATVQSVAPVQTSIPEKSIAVLPFIDMSESHDQDFFSDGLSEELIDRLAKVSELRVPARTSSFFFKGKQTTIADVAKALGVAYVLEGSVRKAGNTLRITVQLIRAADGYHIWSETYDRKADAIFKIQDEVSAAVSQVLQTKLPATATATATATSAPAVPSAEAHNFYLLGLYQTRRDSTRPSNEQAIINFRKALAIAPGYAPAWVALSGALQWSVQNEWIDQNTGSKEARGAAEQAVIADPSSADAHANLAIQLLSSDGDASRADFELAKAGGLDPLNERLLRGLGHAAAEKNRYTEAIGYYKQALARDPLSTGTMQSLASAYAQAGQLPEAEAIYRQTLALDPGPGTRALLSFVLTREGRATEALTELGKETNPVGRLEGFYRAYYSLGRTHEAQAVLSEFENQYGPQYPSWVGGLLASAGESEGSFAWFERAVRQRDPQLQQTLRDPEVAATLQKDSRYQSLLRKTDVQK